ncbi:MAG: type VI secretion system-associated protein TagF [Polyangiaceae bacterium]|nr:type VI secretion system-associated protein TagF [Myxococcales bacterium]MCB9589708.1 type VI secretion system-associated protein TagF [Polyangiaceae bacterium]
MIVGYFGKLPKAGDFLRGGVAGEPASGFERWIEQGMVYGSTRRGDWQQAFDGGALHGFIYRAPPNVGAVSVIVGVIRPSRDTVGRRFPLVIFSQIPEPVLSGAPHIAPLMLGDFFELASEVLLDAHGMTAEEFRAAVLGIPAPRIDQLATYIAEYNDWVSATPLATPLSVTYGQPDGAAAPHAIDTLIQCVAPFIGQEPMTTPLSARLPLGAGGVASAAFWIDVARRVARWRRTVPSAFWSASDDDGTLLLQLGATPHSSLAELWSPDPDSDHVCDLRHAPRLSRESILGRLPPAIGQALNSPGHPVGYFLQALGS